MCGKSSIVTVWVLAFIPSVVTADEPDWPAMPYTTHAAFQAVDADGFGIFPLTEPVKLKGVLLNRSEDMLDSAPAAPGFLGGLWQVYVQAAQAGDFGGTACWMGQYLGKLQGTHPLGSYTDAEWLAELDRLTHDPMTGHEFQPGDLVEIRARAPGLSFRGKTNVNEQHSNDPTLDFDIYLLEADYGLPAPTLLDLADLKDAEDVFIFDPTRTTGCERYQGSLVRLNDVWFVDAGPWGPSASLTITDGTLTFPVLLGRGDGYATFDPPAAPFDLVAILDQEDLNDSDGYRQGYRLWVCQDYDGNGCILPRPVALVGDTNCDGLLSFDDIKPFAQALSGELAYLAAFPCCLWINADCNGDHTVTFDDIKPFVNLFDK